jgi:hypothetical protein
MAENNLSLLRSALTAPGVIRLLGGKPGVHIFMASCNDALDFIERLSLPRDELSLGINPNGVNNKSLLIDYIRRRMHANELNVWDFVIHGRTSSTSLKYSDFKLLPHLSVTPIQRGRDLNGATRLPRLKNLGVGLDEYESTIGDERSLINRYLSEGKLSSLSNGSAIRNLRSPNIGRIFVYPITKYSNQPGIGLDGKSDSELFSEINLQDAPEVVFGFGISLPGSESANREAIDGWVNTTGHTV